MHLPLLTVNEAVHSVLVVVPVQHLVVLRVVGVPLSLHVVIDVAFLRVLNPYLQLLFCYCSILIQVYTIHYFAGG